MANCGPIIPIDLVLDIGDPAEALANGWDKIKIERSTKGEAGPWREITTAQSRLTISADAALYDYTDKIGNGSYYYRYRLFNSSTLTEDSPSDPMPGEQDPILNEVSIAELKDYYLFGLDLTNDAGQPYSDALFAHFIKSSADWLEHKLGIQVRRQAYSAEKHDFFAQDYENYIWLELDNFPVISVEEIRMVLPGQQVVRTFDRSWIHLQRESGQIQLVPGGSTGNAIINSAGAWLPWIHGGNKFIPSVFQVDYTAGFGRPPEGSTDMTPGNPIPSVSHDAPRLDKLPTLLKDVVAKLACFGPLNIAGDLLGGAGIANASISLDGLSTSFGTTSSATSAGFGSRLIQYQKELKDQIPQLQRYYSGLRVRVV